MRLIAVPQSNNSPVTNVLDDYMFAMLSKHLSKEQALLKATSFNSEELWIAIFKVFKEIPFDALA